MVAEECSREFRALPVARLEGSPPPHFWRRNAVHPQRCRLLRTPLELAGESSGLTTFTIVRKSTPPADGGVIRWWFGLCCANSKGL